AGEKGDRAMVALLLPDTFDGILRILVEDSDFKNQTALLMALNLAKQEPDHAAAYREITWRLIQAYQDRGLDLPPQAVAWMTMPENQLDHPLDHPPDHQPETKGSAPVIAPTPLVSTPSASSPMSAASASSTETPSATTTTAPLSAPDISALSSTLPTTPAQERLLVLTAHRDNLRRQIR